RVRELAHGAALVLEVAERDGLGRTGLLAGREDVAVPHRTALVARVVLAGHDALDAHGALLHDAELTNRDVGVQLDLQRRRDLVVPPVEPADGIRAGVAAG